MAPFLAPRFGAKRVVTIHDAVPYVEPRTQPLMTHLVFRTLLPLSRWTADAITTVSHSTMVDLERAMRLPRAKMHITPCGTSLPTEEELETWRRRVPDMLVSFGVHHPYFLYVGALNPRKNVPRLIAAFRQVQETYPEARLLIVGPNTWSAQSALQAAVGLEDAVRLTGFVDEETLHILYAGATALVYPSLYEGFGLPPLEAMAHGTPAITSTTSSLPEVVGDAALLVDPYRVEAIAGAMDRVLTEPRLAQELSEAGRARAALFSWDAVGPQVLDVYRSVLA
jgi:glycosyltransferase involved in cell wall biosynthesis